MTVSATLVGVFLKGVAASRPAANAVAGGTIYSATDTGVITQSDGSSWSTYATISSGLADPMTTRGDIIIRNSSNVTSRLGRGSAGQVLQSDGTDVAWQTPGAGGGLTQAFAGYNTIGGSTETPGVNSKVYAKQITLANDCLITDIEAYLNSASGTSGGPACALYTDSSGSPAQLLGFSVPQLMSYVGGARWIGGAIGKWVAAGTYWIAVRLADTGGAVLPTIAYDGSGSDMTATGLAGTAEDWSIYTSSTTTARKFSIRANTIR